MNSTPDKTGAERLETLEGVLDRLVFTNETSDFIVARLMAAGTSATHYGSRIVAAASSWRNSCSSRSMGI